MEARAALSDPYHPDLAPVYLLPSPPPPSPSRPAPSPAPPIIEQTIPNQVLFTLPRESAPSSVGSPLLVGYPGTFSSSSMSVSSARTPHYTQPPAPSGSLSVASSLLPRNNSPSLPPSSPPSSPNSSPLFGTNSSPSAQSSPPAKPYEVTVESFRVDAKETAWYSVVVRAHAQRIAWRVERRYRELHALWAYLDNLCVPALASLPFPSRRPKFLVDEEVLMERKVLMARYLAHIPVTLLDSDPLVRATLGFTGARDVRPLHELTCAPLVVSPSLREAMEQVTRAYVAPVQLSAGEACLVPSLLDALTNALASMESHRAHLVTQWSPAERASALLNRADSRAAIASQLRHHRYTLTQLLNEPAFRRDSTLMHVLTQLAALCSDALNWSDALNADADADAPGLTEDSWREKIAEHRVQIEATVTTLVSLGSTHTLYEEENKKLQRLKAAIVQDCKFWRHRLGDAQRASEAQTWLERLEELLHYIEQFQHSHEKGTKAEGALRELNAQTDALAARVYGSVEAALSPKGSNEDERLEARLASDTRDLAALRKRLDTLLSSADDYSAAEIRRLLLHVEELQSTVAELRYSVQQRLTDRVTLARRVDDLREDSAVSRHESATSTLFDL